MKNLITLRLFLVFILILLVGGILRFYGIGEKSLWYDEGVTRLMISGKAVKFAFVNKPVDISYYRDFIIPKKDTSPGDIATCLAQTDTHPPLYFILLSFWGGFFGLNDSSLRAMSAFVGSISIIPFFLIALKFFERKVALIASLLFATGYFHISYSQEARMYPLMLFFSLLSTCLVFYLRELESNNLKYYIFSIGFVTTTVCGLYTHYHYFFILLFHFAFLVIEEIKKRRITFALPASAVAVLISYLPWISTIIVQKERSKYLRSLIGANFVLYDAFKKLPRTIELLVVPTQPLLSFGKKLTILAVIAGLIYIFLADRKNRLPIFLWTASIIVPVLITGYFSGVSLSYTVTKYFFMLLPVFYLSAAVSVGKIKTPIISSFLIIFICSYSLAEGYRETIEKNILPDSGIKYVATLVQKNYKHSDMVIFNSFNGRGDILIFSSYIKKPMKVFALNMSTSQNEFLEAIGKAKRIWYISPYDTDRKAKFDAGTPFQILKKYYREAAANDLGPINTALFFKIP